MGQIHLLLLHFHIVYGCFYAAKADCDGDCVVCKAGSIPSLALDGGSCLILGLESVSCLLET